MTTDLPQPQQEHQDVMLLDLLHPVHPEQLLVHPLVLRIGVRRREIDGAHLVLLLLGALVQELREQGPREDEHLVVDRGLLLVQVDGDEVPRAPGQTPEGARRLQVRLRPAEEERRDHGAEAVLAAAALVRYPTPPHLRSRG